MNDALGKIKSDPTTKNRRRSRELALHTLYACEIGDADDWVFMFEKIAESDTLTAEAKDYAHELVEKTMESMVKIDRLLSECAANWELRRMAAIDRNILRLAVGELMGFSQVPFKVVIDEAVELAKMYGTDESGKFVNGVIDSIYKKISATSEEKSDH
jgi:transcription antitermination protein NusB